MKSKSRLIDHLDIQISVPVERGPLFEQWLADFVDHHDYMVTPPKLRQQTLKINSTDLVDFLGFMAIDELTEIEKKRIELQIQTQMQQYIDKTLSPDFRSHYQWCLTAIKNFEWGRHRSHLKARKALP